MSPYKGLPPRAFWKTGVSESHALEMEGIYRKKFELKSTHSIVTAGSCFAQNITRRLIDANYSVAMREPAPPGLTLEDEKGYGYGLYSARYGNIYTVRQLLQLTQEALGDRRPEKAVWQKDGRYFDALRPSVEPEGLSSPEEVEAHRAAHLAQVRTAFKTADVFIFTLGLTEAWEHIASETVYPTAPGTIAGAYDPNVFGFRNFTHSETLEDFLAFRKLMCGLNNKMKFLLTVSPVPLAATASGDHVLPATTYSKSVLRAVAGELTQRFPDIDYFPSYELVAGHQARGFYYEPDLRSVATAGVDMVMRTFFEAHGISALASSSREEEPDIRKKQRNKSGRSKSEVVCEEMLLDAFAR